MFYMVGHLEIKQSMIKNKPLLYFETNNKDGVVKLFKQLKELTGYKYDNKHLKWSNLFGYLFAISIYADKKHKSWEINLWDQTGGIAILRLEQPMTELETDMLSNDVYDEMCQVTEQYVRGFINCSDCKTQIKKSEIAGSYFAGVYCTDCWEGKWKEIEAKETYN
jgi:hypothetical protein